MVVVNIDLCTNWLLHDEDLAEHWLIPGQPHRRVRISLGGYVPAQPMANLAGNRALTNS